MKFYEEENGVLYHGDCLDVMQQLPSNSLDCIITSPPYWKLRDYGTGPDKLGLENDINDYISNLCTIFNEAKRILKKTGICFVNINDSYMGCSSYNDKGRQGFNKKLPQKRILKTGLKNKTLCNVPFRFAIKMTELGWIQRNTIIWHKPNAMPSSVTDRFTIDYEYVFLFTKNTKYYFNQQKEPYTNKINRWGGQNLSSKNQSEWDKETKQNTYRNRDLRPDESGKNKRCVWSIPTKPSSQKHFASYPEKLVNILINTGCPENGVVLDPFAGSGTTGAASKKLERDFILIEKSLKYCEIVKKRLKQTYIQKKLDLK